MSRVLNVILALQLATVLGCQASAPGGLLGGASANRAGQPSRPLLRPPGGGSGVPIGGIAKAPVVSNNGARLFGVLHAPASLISDQGGALISPDSGAGLISKTKPLRVLQADALSHLPVADTRVELVDAAGQPVLDASGQPITTRSDAAGAFRFEVELPDRNVIVRATLAGERGALQAVAARDARGAALEVDLFTTVTTAYLVEKLVAPQADRQQALDRLPGAVALEMRQRAEEAFRGKGVAVPPRLQVAELIASTEALRRADPAFDQQIEAVRQVLIVAGQANRGEGRSATTVALEVVRCVAEGSDGSVYFMDYARDPSRHRLMRVRPDGVLVTVVGGGQVAPKDAEGKRGTEIASYQGEWCFDEAGRVLVGLEGELYRLEEDGTLRRLGKLPAGELIGVRGEEAFTLDWDHRLAGQDAPGPKGLSMTVWRAAPGRDAVRLAAFESPDGLELGTAALVPGKGVLIEVLASATTELRWVDPDSGAVSRWEPPSGAAWVRADRAGNLVYAVGAADQQLWVLPRGATAPVALGTWRGWKPQDVQLGRDGASVLLSKGDHVVRVASGGETLVAGLPLGKAADGAAAELALADATGLAFSRDGDMWLVDNRAAAGTGRVLRVDPEGRAQEVPVTEPVLWERLNRNLDTILRPRGMDAVAALTGRLGGSIHEVRKDGGTTLLYAAPQGYTIEDFVTGLDGSMRVLLVAKEAAHRLVERAPDGTTKLLYASTMTWEDVASPTGDPKRRAKHDPDLRACNLVDVPAGGVYLYGQGRLAQWSAGQGFEVLGHDPALTRLKEAGVAATLGPDGAMYFMPGELHVDEATGSSTSSHWGEVQRWDPVSDITTHVAGPRGTVFTGTGIDDALFMPRDLAFSPDGDLMFIDGRSRQVRRVPRDKQQGLPVQPPTGN